MRFGAAIPVLNEWRFLPAVVGQLLKGGVERVFILRNTRAFSGAPAILAPIPKAIHMLGMDTRVTIVEGDWPSEHDTRNYGMEKLAQLGMGYVFTVDADEIFSVEALTVLKRAVELNTFRSLACRFKTYWKSIDYQIDPPEVLVATVLVHRDQRFERLRMFEGEQTAINQFAMHHLSYVRTDEEMRQKIATYGHADEVMEGWFESVWKKWDEDRAMENLHPTHPIAMRSAMRSHPGDRARLQTMLREHGVLDMPVVEPSAFDRVPPTEVQHAMGVYYCAGIPVGTCSASALAQPEVLPDEWRRDEDGRPVCGACQRSLYARRRHE